MNGDKSVIARKWRTTSMKEALRFITGKTIEAEFKGGYGIVPYGTLHHDFADVVTFTDGSAVAVESDWCGPYSSVTPDIDAEMPCWAIGEPE